MFFNVQFYRVHCVSPLFLVDTSLLILISTGLFKLSSLLSFQDIVSLCGQKTLTKHELDILSSFSHSMNSPFILDSTRYTASPFFRFRNSSSFIILSTLSFCERQLRRFKHTDVLGHRDPGVLELHHEALQGRRVDRALDDFASAHGLDLFERDLFVFLRDRRVDVLPVDGDLPRAGIDRKS